MQSYCRFIPLLVLLFLLPASCGYHNPNVYTGPDRIIHLKNWKNRTNELGLDARFYQTLVSWFQRSGSISITKQQQDAQLVLAGEIVSISLPSLSYDSTNTASEVKVRLTVRYVLQDLATGEIVLEEPGEVWSESYLVGASTAETRDNERRAVSIIIDDISERIYQKTLIKLQQ